MSIFTTATTLGGKLGGFEPKALYSFEFRDRKKPSDKTEIFLLLPPESYSMEYGYRTSIHKTIGGTSFDWFGTDNPKITLSGSLWSYWMDVLPAPFGQGIISKGTPSAINDFTSSALNKIGDASLKLVSGFFPLNQMSGLDEFFRIKYFIYDFFSPITGKLAPRSINTLGGTLKGLDFLKRQAELDKNSLDFIEMIYHDYDDNIHWEVVPSEPFKVERARPDSFTARWSMTFTGIRDVRTVPFLVPAQSKKINPDDQMRAVADALLAIDLPTIAEFAIQEQLENVINLRKLSFDTFFVEYEKAIDEFFNGKKDNLDELIHQAFGFTTTAEAAGDELVTATTGLSIPDYIAASSASSLTQNIVDSGRDEKFAIIAESIVKSKTLEGTDAYTGRRIAITEGQSGETVEDFAPITDETFAITESEAGTVRYAEERWTTYIVKRADNLGKIAVQQLGDYSRFPEIGKLNNLILADFLLDNMVGKTIKLPEVKSTNFNNGNNLVYKSKRPDAVNNSILLEELIGRDLRLNANRDFVLTNSGDLATSLPMDGLAENIRDITIFSTGTLPLFPEWGLDVGDIGSISNDVQRDVVENKVINSVEKDPRITTVNMNKKTIRREGDRIYFDFTASPIIGGELTIGGT